MFLVLVLFVFRARTRTEAVGKSRVLQEGFLKKKLAERSASLVE